MSGSVENNNWGACLLFICPTTPAVSLLAGFLGKLIFPSAHLTLQTLTQSLTCPLPLSGGTGREVSQHCRTELLGLLTAESDMWWLLLIAKHACGVQMQSPQHRMEWNGMTVEGGRLWVKIDSAGKAVGKVRKKSPGESRAVE
ncbi:hypothetical protein V6N11_060368 [Hibiscus sabdariffa]|uniref:Uncharacterized protein n=1 Tax=Hibiscus sabdariffa TaxID=183260 RepID=A0ABR2QQ51_9ROSI